MDFTMCFSLTIVLGNGNNRRMHPVPVVGTVDQQLEQFFVPPGYPGWEVAEVPSWFDREAGSGVLPLGLRTG